MVRRIRRKSDLPDWFDRDKYAAAERLGAAGWYDHLYMREHLFTQLVVHPRSDAPGTISEVPLHMQMLEQLRATPLMDIADDELFAYYFHGCEPGKKAPDRRFFLGVRLATVREHYLTEGRIETEKRTYARKFFAELLDPEFTFSKPVKYKPVDWMAKPIDALSWGMHLNVRVNLALPDNVLVEHFKRLLNDVRAWPRRGPKLDYAAWIKFGVLPYLDLSCWQREVGVKIPNRVMADAIFPAGEGGEEVVRKTTAKLAVELLAPSLLELLATVAAREMAEQKKT